MTDTTGPMPAPTDRLLLDVQSVLAAAFEHIVENGWRREAKSRGRAGGARIVDALNYASAQRHADRTTHLLAFACTAMAIELHTSTPAHALLHDDLVDEYLSPDASDGRLHQLDAAIVVAYNERLCGGVGDARALLLKAFDHAEAIIAAQLNHQASV